MDSIIKHNELGDAKIRQIMDNKISGKSEYRIDIMKMSIHESRLKFLSFHPETITKSELSEIFHFLWTRDVGMPGYNKDMWKILESFLLCGSGFKYLGDDKHYRKSTRPITCFTDLLGDLHENKCSH